MGFRTRRGSPVVRESGAGDGRSLLALVVLLLCLFTVISVTRRSWRRVDARNTAQDEAPAVMTPFCVSRDTLQKGGSLYLSLKANGLSDAHIEELTRALKPVLKANRVHPGDHYTATWDSSGAIQRLEYVAGVEYAFIAERGPRGLQVRKEARPLEVEVRGVHGTISDCFHNAIIDLGEGPQLMWSFVEILGWDIDFNIDTRAGDEFRLLFEEYQKDGARVKYGRVLAAEYLAERDTVVAVFYESPSGHSDYYHLTGGSVRKTFLKAPLKFRRISSRYSLRRYHPILKIRCPHRGVDYSAPVGTPVQATGDGVVAYAGWKGSYGRLVEIRHKNGYVTRYGHLSRYARGIKKGVRVHQRDTIGYVGSSGRSTGPHLHFELRRNGTPINPLTVNFPAAEPVPESCRADFERVRDERFELLRRLRQTGPRVADAGELPH